MKQAQHLPTNKAPSGQLYVVATPIGNLGEMSKRACEILHSVDVIACEDTRHTKKLCSAFGIATPLTSYYREKEQQKSDQLVNQLLNGKNIALVSDAGTPGLSDPGAILVKKARNAGIPVSAVAGPSALAAALSISGITETGFFFAGFLPAKSSERRQILKSLRPLPYPLVFYASPHKIQTILRDLLTVLGNRDAQLIRELTKIHEECREGTLNQLVESVAKGVKGELVLIVQGAAAPHQEKPDNLHELVTWYRDEQNATLKDTVRHISGDLDLPRSAVYKEVLALWNDSSDS
ncbi:16S rRNA (cytidine(1402)-2'-O)-methyltransferase [Desulfogranum marinum]|uniref:16S rRNA (cytidine(1402)-2'-O)-methyltransferase n=1 Tax=Desulfogranum marinum TaxID=453220 RepID=UPI001963CE44|nr:16S rRNA (cytidine(1402)-2'-O)-methyltransferase [Desulfogranum marinum]MBM9510758.1 16S rRNA (cytidine(1402)-2'-O)-methyltransferase [Desulfogranum marinum]